MSSRPLVMASLEDVCRPVDLGQFDPGASDDRLYKIREEEPVFGSPVLMFDRTEDMRLDVLHSYMNGGGRRHTFLAHLADALVAPDVLGIIASGNKFVFPNSYCEIDAEEAFKYYFTRSMHLSALRKYGPDNKLDTEYYLSAADGANVITIDEPVILFANQSSNNYWHFMTETFSRLWCIEKIPALSSCAAIVRRKGDNFEKILSDLSGIPQSRMLALDWRNLYRFRHLIYPSALCDRAITPAKVAWIRQRFASALNGRFAGKGRRIYLARLDRGTRQILNQDQVLQELERHGFETVVPSGLSLMEQAALFAEAEIIIGPHGAALTNMVFMAPGSVAIEMAPRVWEPLFFTMASACRLQYIAIGSQWDFYQASAGKAPVIGDPAMMLVDIPRLRAALDQAIAYLPSRRDPGGV